MTQDEIGVHVPVDTDNTPEPEDGPQDDLPQEPNSLPPGWAEPDDAEEAADADRG